MAATNFTPISLYYSSTASAAPSAGNLVAGELALNTLDEKLYFKNLAGTVKLLASNAGSAGSVTSVAMTVPSVLSISGSPITSSGTLALTYSGTALPVANGGTGVTTSTGTGNTVRSASPTLSGDVNLSTGNLVIGTAGKGIDFSITSEGSGTMTSELLADYEEGTWTPTLTPATSGTITLGSPNLCGYTKIGRIVTVNGLIDTASVSAPVGSSVTFNNLPFTSNATGTQRSAGAAVCFALTSGTVATNLTIVSSTTSFVLQVNASLFQLGSQVYFQLSYTV